MGGGKSHGIVHGDGTGEGLGAATMAICHITVIGISCIMESAEAFGGALDDTRVGVIGFVIILMIDSGNVSNIFRKSADHNSIAF